MRNYTINDEKTATIRNLYNGDEFTIEFPFAGYDEMEKALERATSNFVTIGELNGIAERLVSLEDEDADKLEAMAEYCDDLDEVEEKWIDSYFIPDTTLADYAEEFCYECGYMPAAELPEWISCHIDWEGVGRELSFDGYSEINDGVLYVAQ